MGPTISAPLRLPAIGAASSLTLAVEPQVLVLPATSGRTVARPESVTLPAFGGIRTVLSSGFSWRTKAGGKVGECGVFRQVLGVAQHVGWNPVGEVLLQDAVCPGR